MPSSTIAGFGIRTGSRSVPTIVRTWRDPSFAVNAPDSDCVPGSAGPWSRPTTASVTPSTRMTGPLCVDCTHGDDVPSAVPGATTQLMATSPVSPSIRRPSSDHGSRPATPVTSASVTRTLPDAVVNVVVSTLVPGT